METVIEILLMMLWDLGKTILIQWVWVKIKEMYSSHKMGNPAIGLRQLYGFGIDLLGAN